MYRIRKIMIAAAAIISVLLTLGFESKGLPNFQKAKVTRVVDGDTIVIDNKYKVRLIGVNAPESTIRTEEYGQNASSYTKKTLLNKTIYLEKDVSETDTYGRLLRIIWLEQPKQINESEIRTKMYNAKLVLDGYAEPSTYVPDVKYSDYFRKFGREAREKEIGLWRYEPNGTTKGDSLGRTSNAQVRNSAKNNSIVYYVPNGKVYHLTKDCETLKNSKKILSGKLQDAVKSGKVNLCRVCEGK